MKIAQLNLRLINNASRWTVLDGQLHSNQSLALLRIANNSVMTLLSHWATILCPYHEHNSITGHAIGLHCNGPLTELAPS